MGHRSTRKNQKNLSLAFGGWEKEEIRIKKWARLSPIKKLEVLGKLKQFVDNFSTSQSQKARRLLRES